MKQERLFGQIVAVEGFRDPEGLAESTGPRRERSAALPSSSHHVEALDREQTPEEDGLPFAFLSGDSVQAPVHTVAAIDIGAAGGPEHGPIPVCHSAERGGMRRRVVSPAVRFGFDHHARACMSVDARDQARSEKRAGDFRHRRLEERSREAARVSQPFRKPPRRGAGDVGQRRAKRSLPRPHPRPHGRAELGRGSRSLQFPVRRS